jgi:hypothetical protein
MIPRAKSAPPSATGLVAIPGTPRRIFSMGIGTPMIGAGPAGIYPMQSSSKLAELVVVNRVLTATEIRQWFTYTRARYGLAVTGL